MSLVAYEKSGHVGHLRLNRPDKLNAISLEMLGELVGALDAAAADDDVRVLVLSGEGRAFSAGFDLQGGEPASGESRQDFVRRELETDFDGIMRFWDFPKPIIAAVHGYCLGSSMEITAVCDITIAAEDCRFGAPEVSFGSGIVCMILPWIIGQKNAREMLLAGAKDISADRAQQMGLVNHVVAADHLIERAMEMADRIAANDPAAVQLTKKAINLNIEATGLRDALRKALEIDVLIESMEEQ
jgi:enoyl-CoA hydratase